MTVVGQVGINLAVIIDHILTKKQIVNNFWRTLLEGLYVTLKKIFFELRYLLFGECDIDKRSIKIFIAKTCCKNC